MNIGWIAASIAALFHGSYTVPMKGKAANSVNIDPFVFQTFKTFMCFSTCWFVLLLDDSLKYSTLGIPAGFLWVVGGTSGIFAVRNAGIALSVGIWSSVIVLVSYLWGIIVFDEKVHSKFVSFVSIMFMSMGLSGMSFASSQIISKNQDDNIELTEEIESGREKLLLHDYDNDESGRLVQSSNVNPANHLYDDIQVNSGATGKDTSQNMELFNMTFSRRKVGIIAAVCNGLFSGTSFVPMQYLSEDEKGLAFIISFAVGAAIVTTFFWIIRFFFQVYKTKSITLGYKSLPSFHLNVMWLPGCFSGLLWSIGNVGNILAVSNLGQAVGVSLGQAAMIVSGLWGIFWYREIVNSQKILIWFLSAVVTCLSISILCTEHI